MNILHIPTVLVMLGSIYLVMPFVTWSLLKKELSGDVKAWCTGGFLMGFGIALLGLRPYVSAWISYPLANFLLLLGMLSRLGAFRLLMKLRWRTALGVLLSGAAILVFEIIRRGPSNDSIRVLFIASVYSFVFSYQAFIGWRFATEERNGSAYWIVGTALLLAIALITRGIETWLGVSPENGFGSTVASGMVVVAALLYGLISHVAFAGVKLEQSRGQLKMLEREYQGILNRPGFSRHQPASE